MDLGVIYVIVNSATGKFYLGSTTDYQKRIRSHFKHLREGAHHSSHLQNSWNKWGEDYFFSEILYESQDLRQDEQKELDFLLREMWNCTYNISPKSGGGDLLTDHPRRDEIIKKRSGKGNHQYKDGRSKLFYVCPKCGGRKGREADFCLTCKRDSGWKPTFKPSKVEIFGIEYTSYTEASRALKVPLTTVRGRCKNKEFRDWKILE